MAGFKFKMTGFDAASLKLKHVPDRIRAGAGNAMREGFNKIADNAKSGLPSQLKAAGGSVWVFEKFSKDVEFEVFCNYATAAYIEFGTGDYAAAYTPILPQEWRDYAMSFFVNGMGTTPATPFLYPAFIKNVDQIKRNIQSEVQKAVK